MAGQNKRQKIGEVEVEVEVEVIDLTVPEVVDLTEVELLVEIKQEVEVVEDYLQLTL